jgi:hypothetical protein
MDVLNASRVSSMLLKEAATSASAEGILSVVMFSVSFVFKFAPRYRGIAGFARESGIGVAMERMVENGRRRGRPMARYIDGRAVCLAVSAIPR